MTTVVGRRPIAFAALPLSSWAFAVRIWLAVIAALHVGFWLGLEAASSASRAGVKNVEAEKSLMASID
jgi:hypothetical protein